MSESLDGLSIEEWMFQASTEHAHLLDSRAERDRLLVVLAERDAEIDRLSHRLAQWIAMHHRQLVERDAEIERLQKALKDAYETMNAACQWASQQAVGITTVPGVDAHIVGYDALLDGTVRAGQSLGVLRGRVGRFDLLSRTIRPQD